MKSLHDELHEARSDPHYAFRFFAGGDTSSYNEVLLLKLDERFEKINEKIKMSINASLLILEEVKDLKLRIEKLEEFFEIGE